MEGQRILLNARGTVIEAPYGILEKSPLIRAWYEGLESKDGEKKDGEKEDDMCFYLNCRPDDVHAMIDRYFGDMGKNIDEYLMMNMDEKYHKIKEDICEVKMYGSTRLTMTYLSERDDISIHMILSRRDTSDTVLSNPHDSTFLKLRSGDGYFSIDKREYFTLDMMHSDRKLDMTCYDIANCMKQYQVEYGTLSDQYIERNDGYIVNKAHKIQNPKYKGTIMFDFDQKSHILLHCIMKSFYGMICSAFKLTPCCVRKIIDVLERSINQSANQRVKEKHEL
jgi:hypothetical protein